VAKWLKIDQKYQVQIPPVASQVKWFFYLSTLGWKGQENCILDVLAILQVQFNVPCMISTANYNKTSDIGDPWDII